MKQSNSCYFMQYKSLNHKCQHYVKKNLNIKANTLFKGISKIIQKNQIYQQTDIV